MVVRFLFKRKGKSGQRGNKSSGAKGLIDYIRCPETEDKAEKCLFTQSYNTISQRPDLTACEIAATEFAVPDVPNGERSGRLLEHVVVSFQEHEMPTCEEITTISQSFLAQLAHPAAIGIMGTHVNTENLHIHLAMQRYSPWGEVVGPQNPLLQAHKLLCEFETEYGFLPEPNGLFVATENGPTLRAERERSSRDLAPMKDTFPTLLLSSEGFRSDLVSILNENLLKEETEIGTFWTQQKGGETYPAFYMDKEALHVLLWRQPEIQEIFLKILNDLPSTKTVYNLLNPARIKPVLFHSEKVVFSKVTRPFFCPVPSKPLLSLNTVAQKTSMNFERYHASSRDALILIAARLRGHSLSDALTWIEKKGKYKDKRLYALHLRRLALFASKTTNLVRCALLTGVFTVSGKMTPAQQRQALIKPATPSFLTEKLTVTAQTKNKDQDIAIVQNNRVKK